MKKDFYKSKDDRGGKLRDVRSFRDFADWFKNVYLYHYKWHTIAIAAVAVFLVYAVVSVVTKIDPDYKVLIGTKNPFDMQAVDAMSDELEAFLPDLDGDGRVVVEINSMYFGGDDPVSVNYRMAFVTMLSDSDILLVLTDEDEEFFLSEDEAMFAAVQPLKGCKKVEAMGFLPDADIVGYIINREAKPEAMEGARAILAYLAR
ncbi:hypothetical protein FACS1894202_09570 [Clostridia bacterium]|nr:hypothetical protein FACS1894202_09570 [Clostridia bacterium]